MGGDFVVEFESMLITAYKIKSSISFKAYFLLESKVFRMIVWISMKLEEQILIPTTKRHDVAYPSQILFCECT